MGMIVSILMALAAPQGAGEIREFQALGAIRDDGAARRAQVSTDRDLDADGMADEGELRFACRAGKVVAASFAPGPATTMIPVGRRTAGEDRKPTITARYDLQAADGRLVGITASQDWCGLR